MTTIIKRYPEDGDASFSQLKSLSAAAGLRNLRLRVLIRIVDFCTLMTSVVEAIDVRTQLILVKFPCGSGH